MGMKTIKNIALVAHDHRKQELVDWVTQNWQTLIAHHLVCTGTTGRLVEEALVAQLDEPEESKLSIRRLKSGPLGGDQQMGALIAEGGIDLVVFFWDPMTAQPHDVDVKALLRIAVLYNIPMACNRSTADFLIASEHFEDGYQRQETDHSAYINRNPIR